MVAFLLLALEILLHAEAGSARRPRGQRQIEIAIQPAGGAAFDEPLETWASEGELGKPQRRTGGGFVALYTPAPETFPRVVLLRVSARVQGLPTRGWLALSMAGSDDLDLRTKPEARVEVALGGRRFGPVRSDAQGHARVHVVVPPGVRLATVRVRDAFGNSTAREVDLSPPPFRCVAAIAEGGEALGESGAHSSIEVFAVTPAGRPASVADLQVSAARGAVSVERSGRPGVFRVSYRPPVEGGGSDTVNVRAFGSSAEVNVRAGPQRKPAPAAAQDEPRASAGLAASAARAGSAASQAGEGPASARPRATRGWGPPGLSAGALLRGQSNLSRAHGGGAAFELAGTLLRPSTGPVRRLEALTRLEGFTFVSQTRPGPLPGDPLRSGALQAFSLAGGVRATLLRLGPADLHATALAGALRSFDTVRVVGGPADGIQQAGARWSALAAAAGGASMPLGPGRALAELQLAFSPARGQLQGNLGGFSLSAGYLIDLR